MTINADSKIFQAATIGGLQMRSRTVMAPMGRNFATNGVLPDTSADYYARRARGNVGLIISEATGVDHPLSTDHGGAPFMHGAASLKAWKRVIDAVHAEGGLMVPQLFHQGMLRGASIADGTVSRLSPSGIVGKLGRNSFADGFNDTAQQPSAPMTDEDIADAIAAYARSAANAMILGFDGVELHGAHGYLIDSFLWKESNKRNDRFGKNRSLFAVEVIKAVRAVMPKGRALLFRFSNHKSSNYDAVIADTPQELETLLGPIADAGVDIIDASIRRFWQPAYEGSDLNLAGWAKKLTGKPSIAVGSVGLNNSASDTFMNVSQSQRADNFADAVKRLEADEFDLLAIGRSLIGDPQYVQKMAKGEQPVQFERSALGTLV